ncbi:hypothetical protein [Gimesia algae]|uniref:LTXXQ motif protein n=1 Tax=Gimesia algae TaxID=2527971 RepID=A0A517VG19_9PLAN|nr:hypothetical protein [Gimesia algae]QDT91966.1 hypothetical protein Pan161_36300 [Gimesia algae]
MLEKSVLRIFVVLFTTVSLAVCSADSLLAQKKESDKPEATAKDTKPAAKKFKGRLPNHYGKLNLSDTQRDKIYKIQANYKSEIDSLKKQLAELNKKKNAEIVTVLEPSQKSILDKILAEASSKKTAKK